MNCCSWLCRLWFLLSATQQKLIILILVSAVESLAFCLLLSIEVACELSIIRPTCDYFVEHKYLNSYVQFITSVVNVITSIVLDLLQQLVIRSFKKFLPLLIPHVSPAGISQPTVGPYTEPVHTFPEYFHNIHFELSSCFTCIFLIFSSPICFQTKLVSFLFTAALSNLLDLIRTKNVGLRLETSDILNM
jgi:hypothetical protein